MISDTLRLPKRSIVSVLAQSVADQGGRLVIVGGWVRDHLLGESSKDFDLEIFGLSRDAISALLASHYFSSLVGRQFPVWRNTQQSIDVGYPRDGTDLYSPDAEGALEVAFREASRHRDLTINAIGWDPISQQLIDPWEGCRDLRARRLKAVSPETFGRDPLRVLRTARLGARLNAEIDPALVTLCRGLDLSSLPVERVSEELRRLLTEVKAPSRAFQFLDQVGQIQVFAPVAALRGVRQDPKWHPEGDVFVHTLRVLDCASEIAAALSAQDRLILLFAALCHDLGKPETTTFEEGRVRSRGHDTRGASLTRDWLGSLILTEPVVNAVEALVLHHLAPVLLVSQGAGPRAYRKLARRLAEGGVNSADLERLARADHLGRTTPDAQAGRFPAGAAFLKAAADAMVLHGVEDDLVSASLLMEHGIKPGPLMGRLLARCRDVQDETGSTEAQWIIERVLDQNSTDGPESKAETES